MKKDELRDEILHLLRTASAGATALLSAAWSAVRGPLIFALQLVAAIILLFEEWGWQPLVAALASLSRFRIWARFEQMLASLPPYAALFALALPTSLLLPLKFVAVYLLAQGHAISAAALFFAAKIASTAFIARIFILTKPSLMQIGWFRSAFEWVVPWQAAMFATIRSSWVWRYGRMLKSRVRLSAKQAWARWTPELTALWADLRESVRALSLRVRAEARAGWGRLEPRLREQGLRLRRAADRLLARLPKA